MRNQNEMTRPEEREDRRRPFSWGVLLLVAVTLTACQQPSGPALYPVTGKVLYQGQPAEGATVFFQEEGSASPQGSSKPLPVGRVGPQGDFALRVDEVGPGAPAGKYNVLVCWNVRPEPSSVAEPSQTSGTGRSRKTRPDGVPDRLAGRFMKTDAPRFRVEVRPGPNVLDPFDVSK